MLGKTRLEYDEHYDAVVGKARGVLQRPPSEGKFKHLRIAPPSELSTLVAHYWFTGWEIEGPQPHKVEVLTHPNFHLVFEKGKWTVSGVHTAKFTRTLAGKSFAFGVKFTPAGFHPFLKKPAASLANKTVAAAGILGPAIEMLLVHAANEEEMVKQATAFLLAQNPTADPTIKQGNQIVENILTDPELTTVDKLAAHTGLNKRSLQRLFREYVGATPKWVIRRYRLHELVERCHSGEQLDFAQLAVDLGYFDQAHLINDFRAIVGYSPTQYQKLATAAKAKPELIS